MRRLILAVVTLTAILGTLPAPAGATDLGREGKIAFVRANQIYTMTKAGASVKQLTTAGKNYHPKWSPDGKKIAYINEANGYKDVWEMSATGTNKVKVTTSGYVLAAAVWSPDGNTLAFGQRPSSQDGTVYVNLVKSTAPFGSPAQLLVGPYPGQPITVDSYLAWSPNGSDLALLNEDAGGPDFGIHLVHDMLSVSPDTVHADETVAATGGECCGFADWSDLNFIPNGVLGYSQVDYGEDGGLNPPVTTVVFPAQRCSSCTDRPLTFVSQDGDKAGTPSPSGAHMVFVRLSGTTPNIWTATIRGAQRKMTQANGYQPDWQPLQ